MRTVKKGSKPATTKEEKENKPTKLEDGHVYRENIAYSITEISRMLEVNLTKANLWITKGLLPCLDVGHRIVLHEDLMSFLRKYRGYDISKPDNIAKLPFHEDDDSNLGA